jgi:hypothetical protein
MVKPRNIEVGDTVRVIAIPPDLHDSAAIGTPEVFAAAVGKTFRVEGIGEYGHLELIVSGSDTIGLSRSSRKLSTIPRQPSNWAMQPNRWPR